MPGAPVDPIELLLDELPPSLFNDLSLPINFVDEQSRIVVMNQAFLDFLKVKLDKVVGTKLMDIDNSTRFPIVIETGIPEIAKPHRFCSGVEATVDRIPIFDGDRVIGAVGMIVVDASKKDTIDAQVRNSILNKIRPNRRVPSERLPESLRAVYTFDDIMTKSSLLKHFKSRAESFARTHLPVLITGESGVGKELFAHAIHNASDRCDKPFVSINCAAIPDTLLESELFGYEAGSFTGASKEGKKGKFEIADGGTIFLDEIGDLPPMMQSKLLRVLQENQIEKIGSSQSRRVDVRIIAATNHDLLDKIAAKAFRGDLYYRLNVLNLNIPSLKERQEDVPLLIDHFRLSYYHESGTYRVFHPEALQMMHGYHWPGNIRELKNIVYRSMVIAQEETITPDLLPDAIKESQYRRYTESYDPTDLAVKGSLNAIMKEIELQIIEDTLKACDYNKTKAAELLGIQRMTLYRKLKRD